MMIMYGQLAHASKMASAAGHGNLSGPALDRIFVIAVVVAAAVAILRLLARSRRRPTAVGRRHPGARYDWRTLPPPDEGASMPAGDEDDCGPLWRYGVPTGYGRVYDLGYGAAYDPTASPGYDPTAGPGYDLPEAPGYDPGYDLTGAPGYGPVDDLIEGLTGGAGYGLGRWQPWDISDDASRDGWS